MPDTSEDTLRALYGTSEPPPPARSFAVGRLAFEMIGGNLRAICFGGTEIIRGIQYLVRDSNWGTPAPVIGEVHVEERSGGIAAAYEAQCAMSDGARLTYTARIFAHDAGLEFAVEAQAIDDLTINRLGFCVLHPAGLAGAPLKVEHGDGSNQDSCFPDLIDPWQPFTDIVALTHRQDGVTVRCALDGDSFEMEDQRNWSDASYKTYVRPLAKPWPYTIPAGTVDRQAVKLEVVGTISSKPERMSHATEVRIGEAVGTMPRIGLVVTPDEANAVIARRPLLTNCGAQDLLLCFDASAGHGFAEMEALARAVADVPHRKTLECVIAVTDDLDTELATIADQLARSGLTLDAVSVFPAPDLQSTPPGSAWPDCPPLADIYAAARGAFPGLALGGGMYGYFTELNRKRPPLAPLDFVSHATCPIVHAADDLSVMQSLEAIPHILRSARAIIGDKPYRLGPVTIGMRQNPYGLRTMRNPQRERIAMATIDPRQDGRFAAAWIIGYVAATEHAALDTLTLGALTGPLGLTADHGPRPIFAAVAALAGLAGQERRSCWSSSQDKVAAVAAGKIAILANLTPDVQTANVGTVEIALAPFAIDRVRLD
jgi:hypothetical protein